MIALALLLFATQAPHSAHADDKIIKYDLINNKQMNEEAKKLAASPQSYVSAANTSGAKAPGMTEEALTHLPQTTRGMILARCTSKPGDSMAEQLKCESKALDQLKSDSAGLLDFINSADEGKSWADLVASEKSLQDPKVYLNIELKKYCGDSPDLACARNLAYSLGQYASSTQKALLSAYGQWARWGKLKYHCEQALKDQASLCSGITPAEKLKVDASKIQGAPDPALLTYKEPAQPKTNASGDMVFEADKISAKDGKDSGDSKSSSGAGAKPPTGHTGPTSAKSQAGGNGQPCPDCKGTNPAGGGGSGVDMREQIDIKLAIAGLMADFGAAGVDTEKVAPTVSKIINGDDFSKIADIVPDLQAASLKLSQAGNDGKRRVPTSEATAILKEVEDKLRDPAKTE